MIVVIKNLSGEERVENVKAINFDRNLLTITFNDGSGTFYHVESEREFYCINDESVCLEQPLRDFQQSVHETAKQKGWWNDNREDGTCLALMHSEISEALEGLRHGNPADDKIPAFKSCEAELADVIIRIFDFAGAKGHDVVGALLAKAEMNKGREFKHGGKKF